VMASGREIYLTDLPQELQNANKQKNLITEKEDWRSLLYEAIELQLIVGKPEIARETIADVESIMIKAALAHSAGKRYEAALLLGYGRNTLTRKIQELGLEKEN